MKIKQLLSALLVSAFACTALASCGSLIKDNAQNDAQNNAPISVASGALTYIGLRINPEIEMVTDENGVVVSANAVNTDGEVVLSTVELEGKTAEEAVVDFTETAVDLGYMDPEAGKDTVYVDVNSEKAELVETVEKTLSDKLMKFFEKKGIAGKVSKEVLDSYLAAATEWNVTPGHAKMIARVLSANPELTYDELLNLTVKDLLELLKADKHADKIAVDCRKDYNEAVKALKEEYKELFELREAIDDIEDDLEDAREEDADEDDKLTEEEIAALEAELAEKKAKAEALDKEFKEKLAALKAEFKVSSEEARKEHKKEADDRKQAKQDGKKYEKPERDDDDDDDDRDDKKPENKPEHDDDDDDRDNKKPEHKPEHDDDDDDHKGKGDKNDKDGKGEKPEHNKDVNAEDDDEEDDD